MSIDRHPTNFLHADNVHLQTQIHQRFHLVAMPSHTRCICADASEKARIQLPSPSRANPPRHRNDTRRKGASGPPLPPMRRGTVRRFARPGSPNSSMQRDGDNGPIAQPETRGGLRSRVVALVVGVLTRVRAAGAPSGDIHLLETETGGCPTTRRRMPTAGANPVAAGSLGRSHALTSDNIHWPTQAKSRIPSSKWASTSFATPSSS